MEQSFALDRKSGIAAWKQIADRLSRSIHSGAFDETGMVPPETALAEQFGVNRHTVRNAIAALAEQGLLHRVQGRGTLVAKRERVVFPITRRTRFSEGVGQQAARTETRILRAERLPAMGEVAESLGIGGQESLIFLELLRLTDGVPISLSANYFPAARFPDMAAAVAETGSVTKAFASAGLADYVRLRTEVIGRLASLPESAHLGIASGAVVLEAISLNGDSAGLAVQFARTVFAADRVSLALDTRTGV